MTRSRDVANIDGILTAKGDIYAATAAATPDRLGVGANNTVLTADSTTATGLKWATPTAGMTNPMTTTGDTIYSSSGSTPARRAIGSTGQVLTVSGGVPIWSTPSAPTQSFTLLNSGGTTLTGTSVTISGLSGYNQIVLLVEDASFTGVSATLSVRLNSDTTASNYNGYGAFVSGGPSWSANNIYPQTGTSGGADWFTITDMSSNATSFARGGLTIFGANSTGPKMINVVGGSSAGGGNYNIFTGYQGYYKGTSVISTLTIFGGTFDAGKIYVYGA